jgi:hypothetical protein
MTKKRGPEKQYASERERNRAKQQRHRDQLTRLRSQLHSVRAKAALNAVSDCIKCNGSELCPTHQRIVDETLNDLGLSENRASTLARKKTRTGDVLPDRMPINHGRAVGASRFTARVDTLPSVLITQSLALADDRFKAREETKRMYSPHLLETAVADELRQRFPNLSDASLLKVMWKQLSYMATTMTRVEWTNLWLDILGVGVPQESK